MSRTRPGNRSHPASGLRRDRVVRSAFLGLLVYALGMIPFYFLTPVHDSLRAVFAQPDPAAFLVPIPAPPTPSGVDLQKKAGADTPSQVDSTPLPAVMPTPAPTQVAGDSRFAFLLLGYGGGSHAGGYLTDSVMVVIVDPNHKTMTLVSLPRDTWIPLPFDGKPTVYNKLNTAYAFARDPSLFPGRLEKYTGDRGAGTFASDTVSNLLGVKISYYATLDFDGFRQAINAVGGIDVDVPDAFSLRYPRNDDDTVDASWMTVRFEKGMQHMDGERAIEYARARETLYDDTSANDVNEGSDFARSQRQRLIIEAFKNRLLQPAGLVHLPQLVAIAGQHVDTNYAIPALTQLSKLLLDWKEVKIYQTAITTANYLEEGTGPSPENTYLLVPNSPTHSWAQIRAFTHHLWNEPAAGVAMAATNVVVENDSGLPGLAGQVSEDLVNLGYDVGEPITGTERAQSRLVDRTNGQATLVAKQLQKDLGMDLSVMADPNVSDTAGSGPNELVLQLGSDAIGLKVTVTPDETAPYSTYGVQRFGAWVPYVPPTATPVPIRRKSPTPERGLPATETPSPEVTRSPVSGHSLLTPATATPRPTATPVKLVKPKGHSRRS